MMDASSRLTERAAELRSAFDRGFAAPLRVDTAAKQELLAIRVGAEPYVVRLSEISGLFADKKITRVPGGAAALLGIAGFPRRHRAGLRSAHSARPCPERKRRAGL